MKQAPCRILGWMTLWFVAGCGNDGTYRLHLAFPDQEARDSVKQVALFALDPGSHSCQELIQGQITPAQMTVFSQLIVDFPSVQSVSLPLVPARKVLFFAEGRVGTAVLLRGCDAGQVASGAQVDITISMEWICHPNPQGEVPGNGIDDDCDGQTDETQICGKDELRLCTCPGGQQGTQACAQDQTHWEDCRCLEEPDGGTEDGGIDPDQSATDDGGVTDEGAADLLPPVRSNPSPQGQLASGTSSANLSLSTDEPSSCRYATTTGVLYDNMINAFNTSNGLSHLAAVTGLADGNSYSFQVRCRDQLGNTNLDDYTIAFSVSEAIDTTPPSRSNGSPSGTLTAGTTSTSLTLNTNEDSFCRYDTVVGTAFGNMTALFNTANGLFHQSTVSGLTNGTSYSFYARCQDQVGNANPDDYAIQFSVALPGDTDPPVRSNGAPSGELAAGTTYTVLTLNTNEFSECRVAQNPGIAFDSMSTLFSSSDGLAHQSNVSGLSDGQTYSFFVRCKDLAGNANLDDYVIGFSVASSGDTTPPVRSNGSPSGVLPPETFHVRISLNTDEDSQCKVDLQAGIPFASMTYAFSTPDGLYHARDFPGIDSGQSYTFYVRCQDDFGNANSNDYLIQFQVTGTTAVQIYRSVGVGSTDPIATSGGSIYLDTFWTAAQFSGAISDIVGVGDILKYDTDHNGSMDAIAMFTRRGDNRTYQIHDTNGGVALAVNTPTTNWAIYRAYNSLARALDGNENPTIGSNFDNWNSSNPPSLTGLGLTWNIACYADSTDTEYVFIDSWNTGLQNYLRIFTPSLPDEVGTSQRHNGVWRNNAYTLLGDGDALDSKLRYLVIEGLQVDVAVSSGYLYNLGVSVYPSTGPGLIWVHDNIFRGRANAGVNNENFGLEIWGTPNTVVLTAWNNVFYDFTGSAAIEGGIYGDSGVLEAYNNTMVDCFEGIHLSNAGAARAVNNLFSSCSTAAHGVYLSGTGYNATNNSSMGYSVSGGNPASDRVNQAFSFENATNRDYHLTSSDTGARDCGTDQMSATFNDDIDGQTRQAPWDIGADEYVP